MEHTIDHMIKGLASYAAALLSLILLTALITSATFADERIAKALQDWHAGRGPLPDLIALQDGLNWRIAPPLTQDELQTVREALWKRELDYIRADTERGWANDKIRELPVFQQMAWTHLLNGGALRAGDFTALHGALLSALQPNTYALAKKWQKLMDCVGTK
jgi:hypothetical protein